MIPTQNYKHNDTKGPVITRRQKLTSYILRRMIKMFLIGRTINTKTVAEPEIT